ncbi:hypothetical protein FRC12_022932 [Ceratobasidium sp. 428]|nr:hypothetical protein FRC12_022932 [Ceratobasidium sp. 428]
MSAKRFRHHPFRNPVKTLESSQSDKVTVIGRRSKAPDAPFGGLTLLPAKVQRMSYAKLAALQKSDTARDEELMKKDMSAADQAHPPPSSFGHLPPNDDMHDPLDDYDDASEDDTEVLEDFGLIKERSDWTERRSNEHAAWDDLLPALCDAYLAFRSGTTSTGPEATNTTEQEVKVSCLELDGDTMKTFRLHASDMSLNAVLIQHGYLGCSPLRPRIAISLTLVEFFANLMRRGGSLSVQVLAKASCDSRNLTAILDVFDKLQREVQRRLDCALGRDGKHYRMLHSCPACMYRLQNEPPLQYSVLATCDGNDSLKRCVHAGTSDHRQFESDYYISPADVNKFQYEVASRKKGKQREEDDGASVCEKRWKNAKIHNHGDNNKPKTVFKETGIFLAACRHSFTMAVCDMIQSGEQAKYGLATINRLVEACGNNLMLGYDIGCTFSGTAARSALLASSLKNAEFCICLGSFHGPAHNRYCQLHNHPHNIPGAGLTDFENCETTFSSTNRIAATTRLASPYHRHQQIHNHLTAYDDDMYLTLGYLLRKKYLNAYQVLDLAGGLIKQLCPNTPAAQLERWRQEKIDYYDALTTEPPENTFAITYIDLLEKLTAKEADYKKSNATSFHISNGSSSSDLRRDTLLTNHLESRRRTALEQLVTVQEAVAQLEDSHGIAHRWTPESESWKNAVELRRKRRYQACIDDLERLMVLRHCETAKAGLAGTGYKQRTNIARGLVARCAAVKSALTRFNEAAVEFLGQQARQLTWDDVVKASTLDDLQLLRESRQQVLNQQWARPEVRQCVDQWHRSERAREEITRLNIEVRRVYTSISDEAVSLPAAVCRIQADNPSLGWAVERYVSRRLKVNQLVVEQLNILAKFPGFTGSLKPGIRLGSCVPDASLLPTPPDIGAPNTKVDDLNADVHAEDEDDASDMFARWRLVLDTVDDDRNIDAGESALLM